jgi:hypothetical protein
MSHPDSTPEPPPVTGNVIDFDEALLDACPENDRRDLLAEAELLARAFAPEKRREELHAMAATLTTGTRDDQLGRAHARRLAAALRRLGRETGDYP